MAATLPRQRAYATVAPPFDTVYDIGSMAIDSPDVTRALPDYEIVRVLARVAAENPHPQAIRLAAQLLGVPACPSCDFVMRPGHVCAEKVRTP
jgi:hypothetical protein